MGLVLGRLVPLVTVWPIVAAITLAILHKPLSRSPHHTAAAFATTALAAADSALGLHALAKDYWAHVFFAMLLYAGGRETAIGDGNIRLPTFTAGAGTLAMLVTLAIHTKNMMHYWIEPPHHLPFFHAVHYIIFFVIMCMFIVAGLAHRSAAAAGSPRAAAYRLVFPSTLVALGVLFVFHLHATLPVPVRMHELLGYSLALIGAVQYAHIVAHERLGGQAAPPCDAFNQAHAFCWFLSATWLMIMSVCLYTKDDTGADLIGVFGEEVLSASIPPAKANEVVWSLFALALLFSAITVSVVCDRVASAHVAAIDLESGGPRGKTAPIAEDQLERCELISQRE